VFAESMRSFLDETRVPQNEFVELSVAEDFFEKVEEDKLGETDVPAVVWPARELISDLISQDLNLREKLEQTFLPGKYEYLMKVCALITSGEGNFEGFIELPRFMIALYYIKSPLTSAEVWLLAETSKLGKTEIEEDKSITKSIHFQPFLRALRRALPELEPLFIEAK
jgi:hypothetical protein